MLFNTIEFVIFFTAILIVIVIIKNQKFQHLLLLAGSYFFFYFSSNYLITLLIFSTILDYYIAQKIWKTSNKLRRKLLLIISLSGNLGLLGFFKYSDFAITQFNILGTTFDLFSDIPLLYLALPIGISFYTFQTISYTVDVYRGQLEPSKSFREFALFVSFFPQLVAGPIVRAKDFLPQLREKCSQNRNLRQIIIENSNLKLGVTIMAFGFLKKMFFADNIAPLVNTIFSNPIGMDSLSIFLGAIAFGIQIYGDFSGYSDIAIGAALILGFKIPMNFNKPYFATSPVDFWRRWHISLSSWLRDYLYIPLGGNKKGPSRTSLNLLTVMVLGGLWHGASINFIIWGALHGCYLGVNKIIEKKIPSVYNHRFFKTKGGKIFSILLTQYFIFLAWIPFRIQEPDQLFYAMNKYLFFDFQFAEIGEIITANYFPVSLIIIFIILNSISYKIPNLVERISEMKIRYWAIFFIVVLGIIVFSYSGNSEDFIYFRF